MDYRCSSENLEKRVKILTDGCSWIDNKILNIPGFALVTGKLKF